MTETTGGRHRSELCRTSCPDAACSPRGDDASSAAGRWSCRSWSSSACSSACPGSASSGIMPDMAAPRRRSRRWPRPPLPRSIRCASTGNLRPWRSTAASSGRTNSPHTPVLVQTDRPSGQESALCRGALARAPAAHGGKPRRRWRRPAAHPRAGARPVGLSRRRGAAPGDRLRLLLRAAGRPPQRWLPGACLAGNRAAAHRRLGDAARLYRQGAGLPDCRQQASRRTVFTVPEDSDLALRVTGGSGEETLVFTDSAGAIARHGARRRRRRRRQAGARRQTAPGGAAVPRQADGRRHAVAEVRRAGTGDMGRLR